MRKIALTLQTEAQNGILPLKKIQPELKEYSSQSNPHIIPETSQQRLIFNIMPGKNVTEILYIREYRIWDHAIEVVFDRKFETEMIDSPDHLIFLSALINLQKMVYVYMNYYLGIDYDPNQPETLKVWPTELNLTLPKMLTDTQNIVHRLNVKTVRYLGENKYYVIADTAISDIIQINGKALIIKL